MTIAESRRLALFESIKTFLGEENAQTLMAYLPPAPDTVATKADVALLGTELRSEMSMLGTELRGEMTVLRSDMTVLRSDMTVLRNEMAALGSDLSAQIARETRSLALAMIGMMLTVLTIALGAVALA
jgi:hypothetical protein